MFIVVIIWFSFNAFLCYSCYIGWTFSDFIRDTWAPYMNDQDVLNQLCDNQWDDKLTYGAYCEESNKIEDCATIRTPEDNARIMYDTDIAYLFFIILGTLSSITVFILQRRTRSSDNLRSLPMLHCWCLSMSTLAMLVCSAVVIDYLGYVMNDIDNYDIYCDDSGDINVNISENLQELKGSDVLFIRISHGVGVAIACVILCMAIRINLKVFAGDEREYFDDWKESKDEREECFCCG